jgi:DHA2 family multidrug resistance protein
LVATFLGALEIVLDRGQEDDWFGSSFIVTFAIICGLAFVAMIPWEITRRNPVVDFRMLGTRQFGSCFVVMLATGAILFSTTQFLPSSCRRVSAIRRPGPASFSRRAALSPWR